MVSLAHNASYLSMKNYVLYLVTAEFYSVLYRRVVQNFSSWLYRLVWLWHWCMNKD